MQRVFRKRQTFLSSEQRKKGNNEKVILQLETFPPPQSSLPRIAYAIRTLRTRERRGERCTHDGSRCNEYGPPVDTADVLTTSR